MNSADPSRDPVARALAALSRYDPSDSRSVRIREHGRRALASAVSAESIAAAPVSNRPMRIAPALVGIACAAYLFSVISAAVRLAFVR
jgi:hypothetical protein